MVDGWLRLIGQSPSLPDPQTELAAFLSEAHSLGELETIGFAPQILEHSQIEARGERWIWKGESDLKAFWQAIQAQDLEVAWVGYGLLLPGFQSSKSHFAQWLEAQRTRMIGGLLSLAPLNPTLVEKLVAKELAHPTDKTRALVAYLLMTETQLRQNQGKAAVLALAPALGLHELIGQEFSALTLA